MNNSSDRMRQFGDRLRKARVKLGWPTVRAFAKALDELETTVSMWERGERYPRVDNLARIKEKTGLSSDWLLYGDPAGLPTQLARELDVPPGRPSDKNADSE